MLTFSKLMHRGRIGNQLFQLASTAGLALTNKTNFKFPPWKYSKYFKGDFNISQNIGLISDFKEIKEAEFTHYNPIPDKEGNYDLNGYFQSEKYWIKNKETILNLFEFNEDFEMKVYNKYLNFCKRSFKIAISIRRGDYVNNKNYAQLPITWYFTALEKHFPDWETKASVMIFSDDIEYCKVHFGNYENVFYAENKFDNNDKTKYTLENPSAIEQLCLGSMCDHFIIANSSFSWWLAYLGQTQYSKVIRPTEYFAGPLLVHDIKDYYPKSWIPFAGEKIDLSDVTFMIPVSYDHNDRKENLGLNVCLLQKYFDTNIIVGEQGRDVFNYFTKFCYYYKFNYLEFHRTKMLNEMAKMSNTPIIVNWDADVFISPLQILQAVNAIRDGVAMVFPYDGRFARVPRKPWFKDFEKSLDVGIVGNTIFDGMRKKDKLSVGGAIIFDKEMYFDGGGENEYFVSYGPEDVERDCRFRRLNYRVERTPGVLYHLDHYKGPNSKSIGKWHKQNHDELDKIYAFKGTGLREYVDSWLWKEKFKK